MAGICNTLNFGVVNRSILQLFGQVGVRIVSVKYSNKVDSIEDDLIRNVDEGYNEDELNNREEEIERKRNKSRLASHHRRLINNEVPYLEPKTWYHNTVKYKQKLYGLYGEASGVNPSLSWPSRGQLAEMLEYESVAFPKTLVEEMSTVVQEKEIQKRMLKEREEDVLKKFSKLEQWKQELNERIMKKEAGAIAAKAKKDRLVEEVRRHFGFKIDPRDDRFKEMLEKKEKEEKKLAKEAKRKAKEAKTLAKLSEMYSQKDKVPNAASQE